MFNVCVFTIYNMRVIFFAFAFPFFYFLVFCICFVFAFRFLFVFLPPLCTNCKNSDAFGFFLFLFFCVCAYQSQSSKQHLVFKPNTFLCKYLVTVNGWVRDKEWRHNGHWCLLFKIFSMHFLQNMWAFPQLTSTGSRQNSKHLWLNKPWQIYLFVLFCASLN